MALELSADMALVLGLVEDAVCCDADVADMA